MVIYPVDSVHLLNKFNLTNCDQNVSMCLELTTQLAGLVTAFLLWFWWRHSYAANDCDSVPKQSQK